MSGSSRPALHALYPGPARRPASDQQASPQADIDRSPQDDDRFEDEERVLAGRLDANYPAMLTKDVPGG